jgi:hypothetical protein
VPPESLLIIVATLQSKSSENRDEIGCLKLQKLSVPTRVASDKGGEPRHVSTTFSMMCVCQDLKGKPVQQIMG